MTTIFTGKTMVFSTNTREKPKSPFYYLSHPHEAYRTGYNTYLGSIQHCQESFSAYNYYLPQDVVNYIPGINLFFHTLITQTNIPENKRKRRTYYAAIDITINILTRIFYLSNTGRPVVLGSNYLNPISWTVIGNGETSCRMYKMFWKDIFSIINHYNTKYESPCHCIPVVLYQKETGGRSSMNALLTNGNNLNPNIIMTGAIRFFVDFIQNVGPDCKDFSDIFTNDSSVTTETVDIAVWKKAKEKALCSIFNHKQEESQVATKNEDTSCYFTYKPTRRRIKITDMGSNLLSDNVYAVTFNNIARTNCVPQDPWCNVDFMEQ